MVWIGAAEYQVTIQSVIRSSNVASGIHSSICYYLTLKSHTGSRFCFLLMTLSCWFHWTWTYSMHWSGMRISTSKSEAMVLNWKKVVCLLRVGGESLPQVEELKYLGVLFMGGGAWDWQADQCRVCCHTGPLWWLRRWAERRSSQFTGQSTLRPWPMVKSSGSWLKGWDPGYKQMKWASSVGWLGAPETGGGAQSAGRSSE